jgi:hypothetical protein
MIVMLILLIYDLNHRLPSFKSLRLFKLLNEVAMEENIYKQHDENTDWMSRVAFYKDEITILQGVLSEIASKNTGDEALKEVEHYQNQFIVQRDNLDQLAHNIRLNEQKFQQEVNDNPVAVDHRRMEYHQAEKDFIEYFENNFKGLRTDFKTFSSKWM